MPFSIRVQTELGDMTVASQSRNNGWEKKNLFFTVFAFKNPKKGLGGRLEKSPEYPSENLTYHKKSSVGSDRSLEPSNPVPCCQRRTCLLPGRPEPSPIVYPQPLRFRNRLPKYMDVLFRQQGLATVDGPQSPLCALYYPLWKST